VSESTLPSHLLYEPDSNLLWVLKHQPVDLILTQKRWSSYSNGNSTEERKLIEISEPSIEIPGGGEEFVTLFTTCNSPVETITIKNFKNLEIELVREIVLTAFKKGVRIGFNVKNVSAADSEITDGENFTALIRNDYKKTGTPPQYESDELTFTLDPATGSLSLNITSIQSLDSPDLETILEKWQVVGCWPKEIEKDELDKTSSEDMIERVVLSCDYVVRTS